jgi:hypothetical protein
LGEEDADELLRLIDELTVVEGEGAPTNGSSAGEGASEAEGASLKASGAAPTVDDGSDDTDSDNADSDDADDEPGA